MTGRSRSVRIVLWAAFACVSAGSGHAQDAGTRDAAGATPTVVPATPSKALVSKTMIETMVVTGTRGAQRSILTTPVPIDVITSAQINDAGALGGEFGQALQNLVPSFNLQRQSNSGAADIVRPAQLRGMSPDQVLVLVNGKRRHTTSITGIDAKTGRGTAPVDFNSIPSNAISRVEVLRDGAGAQYGSDAIAGVINVILDERREGIDSELTWGEHVTRFSPAGNKDIRDGKTLSGKVAFGLPLGSGGFLRAGAEYKNRDETNRSGIDTVPFFEDEANIRLVGGRRNYKPGDGAAKDLNLWINAGAPISDAIEAYGFGTFNRRDAEGTGFFRYPIGFANIQAVYPSGYRPITTGLNKDLAFASGLRGKLAQWNWDASLNFGRNEFDGGVKHSLNPSLGPASPHKFDVAQYENAQISGNFDTTRNIRVGLASPATLALGVELRRQKYASHTGDVASYVAGPLADSLAIGAQAGNGLRPEETRNLDRNVYSAYAELSADVLPTVFVDVAGRYERSNDFSATTSGKLSARWEFIDGFALRGAVSNSFRAPSLVQLGFGTSSTSFGAGGRLTTVNTLPVDDPLARALGAQRLDPETSRNLSLGVTGSFDVGLNLSADVFRIDVDDRITLSERIDCGTPVAAEAVSLPPGTAGFLAAVGLSTADTLCDARNITAANFFTNAVNTRTDGIDVVASYATTLFGGTWDVSASYSFAETRIRKINNPAVAGVILLGVEEQNTIEDAAPQRRAILTSSWRNDTWSVLGRLTYQGETTRVFNFGGGFEPRQTYDAKWQFDTDVAFKVTDSVKVHVGASNLFDTYPNRSSSDINFFGNLPYDVLSPVGFNGRFVYATAQMTL